MTRVDEQKVRVLAFDECCNYYPSLNGERHWCLARPDHRCVFASDERLPRCGWFEKAVLPLRPELGALCLAERKAAAHGQRLTPLQAEMVRESVSAAGRRRRRTG